MRVIGLVLIHLMNLCIVQVVTLLVLLIMDMPTGASLSAWFDSQWKVFLWVNIAYVIFANTSFLGRMIHDYQRLNDKRGI